MRWVPPLDDTPVHVERIMQLCHQYKIRCMEYGGLKLVFADDAFVPDEPTPLRVNTDGDLDADERELAR